MIPTNDLATSVRYRMELDIDQACQSFITWISQNCAEIFLVQQESSNGMRGKNIVLKLIHRTWGHVASIELIQNGSPHTLLSLTMSPDPELDECNAYEDRLLEAHPEEVWSLRLALMDGHTERGMNMLRSALRTQRLTYFAQIHYRMVIAFSLQPAENDPYDIDRDIPNRANHSSLKAIAPTQVDDQLLELWVSGYTARQIAGRTDRTEKTILNRLSLLRKAYGEQVVPRRKTA